MRWICCINCANSSILKKLNKIKYLRYIIHFPAHGVPRPIQLLLALGMGMASFCGTAADFTFAAFGDTPYVEDEEARFIGMIAEINREQLAFAVHVGDFKSGWSPCTDAIYHQRAEWFALFQHPLIYTPGDNEWSDCWRVLGAAQQPMERLQKLRSLFFADQYSLGQHKIVLTRQNGGYPEHARWTHENIVFATFNVPGGYNNSRMPEEAAARGKMLGAWIENTFGLARAHGHAAVVLILHANPFARNGGIQKGYADLMTTILKETLEYKGEVLLIHGDTHRYRIDQPLADLHTQRPVGNFTRLEVFGYPIMNWVRVRVSQRGGKITFAATPGG